MKEFDKLFELLERKYPAKAPKGDSFIKSTGVPSRVDSRKSTTDQYVRTHKNPTTTHAKKFGKREESYIQELDEKKKKADRCKRKADSVYGSKTSAYKSGAIVRCRQGKIWKKK